MAAGDYVHTNPVAASQAIALEKLRAAAKETAAINDAAFTQSMINAGIKNRELAASREDRASQREFTSRENDKLNALTAEDQRLRREANIEHNNWARTKADTDEKRMRGADIFQAIQTGILGNDPPTDSELNQAFTLNKDVITPEMQAILKAQAANRRATMIENAAAGENMAAVLEKKRRALKAGDTLGAEALQKEYERVRGYVDQDPTTGEFRARARRPRVDPAGVSGVQSFSEIRDRVYAKQPSSSPSRGQLIQRTGPMQGPAAPTQSQIGNASPIGPLAMGYGPVTRSDIDEDFSTGADVWDREIGNAMPIGMSAAMEGWKALPGRIQGLPAQVERPIEMDPRLDELLRQFESRRSPAFAVPGPAFAPPEPLGAPYGMEFQFPR